MAKGMESVKGCGAVEGDGTSGRMQSKGGVSDKKKELV